MTLQDIFDQLSYGELSQLSIGGEAPGVISETNFARVAAHVRLGLTALYTRFNLKEGRAVFRLQPGKLQYVLDSNEDVFFLVDNTGVEFSDDILKIERVVTQSGRELAINDKANAMSCTTPSANVLRLPMDLTGHSGTVPDELRTSSLTVQYRANHPAITVPDTGFIPNRVPIELPDSHLYALLMFVASRVNNPVGMSGDHSASHSGNNYYMKYLEAVQTLENQNLEVDDGETNMRLRRNGWA